MRVALLHPRAARTGGVEGQIHELGVRLAEAGHEVHWICSTRDPRVDARLRCHRVPEPPGLLRAARPWVFDRLAQRALARFGPFDVMHGFGKTTRQDVYRDGSGCFADFQAGAFEGRGSGWRSALRRLGPQAIAAAAIERARYRPGACRFVLPISALVREQILRRYPLAPERVRVLHPAVDTARFSPRLAPSARPGVRAELALPAAAPLLAFVGGDFQRKGLPALLAALPLLPGAHALVLGGARPARLRRARELASALGVEGRVRFAGARPDPERLLAAADCLVFPSRFDAFGNAVLEAMASGLPVVVSRRAGAAEVVIPGRTGAVVDAPEDAPALAAAIRPFLDPLHRAEAGRQARQEAEQHGWETQLAFVLAVYREVGEEKRREAALTRPGSGGTP
jgi:UDP-glucose:(heptosyl)LPS alpha-1,3-glucosyltransferase